jgi:hexokinase
MTMGSAAQVKAFLRRHGLSPASLDVAAVQASFLSEMEAGLAGEPSSLAMIPTYVTIDRPVPADTPVTVMDAGGTNLRVGTVRFSAAGVPEITDFHKFPMPGVGKHASKDDFFGALAEVLRPVAAASPRIGFCFSYPTQITPECDGKLLHWTKEIQAPDVVGTFVGAELAKRLAAVGCGGKRIVILNDTIATLLAGKSFGGARRYANYTGVIVGTGSNTAYVETNARIAKLPGLPAGAMAINLESGGFAKCPRSDFDVMLDAALANPGRQMFEKMISGGYLGGVGLQVLRTAATEGLLSPAAGALIGTWKDLATKDMDDFLTNPFLPGLFADPAFTETDLERMMLLCAEVVRRAAVLIAINISTPVIKTGSGKNPLHPVCITVDGSTYYKTTNLKSMVEENLRRLLGRRGIHFEVLKVDEAPLIGAAVAGLTV